MRSAHRMAGVYVSQQFPSRKRSVRPAETQIFHKKNSGVARNRMEMSSFINIRPSNHVPNPSQSWLLNAHHCSQQPNPNHGAQPILDTLYFSSCSDLLSIATDWLALFPGAIPTRLRPHGLALAHNALALLLRLVYGLSQDWCCGARRKGPA